LLAVLWHVSDHVGGKGSVGLWVQDLGTTGIDCEWRLCLRNGGPGI